MLTLVASLLLPMAANRATDAPLTFNDPAPQRYELTARASRIDPRTRPHPEIGFVFEKNGKPADVEKASVDTRVKPQGKLVIWLMGYNAPLFERLNGYGLHAIQVHYANGWFDKMSKLAPPTDDQFLGNIRLEAATGEDFSKAVDIPQPDGMMERAVQFVKWLAKENPPGRWEYFLSDDRQGLCWERVIIAGASHGSTTAARFAKYQRVDRVVMFCGPRDQYETWQGLPSATPANRFFAFSHVLDGGWTGHHYDRSWELLKLNQFGPIVDVDHAESPYGNTRRLVTAADVKNDARRAHSSVVPGGAAVKDASGRFIHEDAWRYLFTHPVEQVGQPVPHDPGCPLDLRAAAQKPAAAGKPQVPVLRKLQPLSVRGVNYYPRETPWGGMWTKTPAEVWQHDMALAASLGVNTVRTFLPFDDGLRQAGLVQADGAPTAKYLEKVDVLLDAASRHGIRVILCFEFSQQWLAAPDVAIRCEQAISAVVGRYRDDGRILLWDLMNEPEDDAKWTAATQAYLRAASPLVGRLDPNHLTTVGLTWRIDRLATVGLPDVLQYHEYCPKAQLFEKGPARVSQTIANQRKSGGARPLLIGEFGMSTARDPQHGVEESLRAKIGDAPGTEAEQARLYEVVLAAAEKDRVAGVLPWCLYDYPIKNPDESRFGLVRSDGSLKPAAQVLRASYGRWGRRKP